MVEVPPTSEQQESSQEKTLRKLKERKRTNLKNKKKSNQKKNKRKKKTKVGQNCGYQKASSWGMGIDGYLNGSHA